MSNPTKFHNEKLDSERIRLVRFTFDHVEYNDNVDIKIDDLLETLVNLFGYDMYLYQETSLSDKVHFHGCINLEGKPKTNRAYINQLKKLCERCNYANVAFKQPNTYHRQQVNKELGITIQDFAYIYDSKDGLTIHKSGLWEDAPTGLYQLLEENYKARYKHNKSKAKVPYLTQLTRDYKLSESYNNYCSKSMQSRMIYGQERSDIFDSILRYVWDYSSSYNKVNDVKKLDTQILTSFAFTIYNCYYESKGIDFERLNPFTT